MSRFEMLWRHVEDATRMLSPLFDIEAAAPLLIPHRGPGGFIAEFNNEREAIFVDVPKLVRTPDDYLVHTMGEEVGHFLHFRARPAFWKAARPGIDAILAELDRGERRQPVWRAIAQGNLLEMIGFFSGLKYLEVARSAEVARGYVRRGLPEVVHYQLSGVLPLIELLAGKAFDGSPSGGEAPDMAALRATNNEVTHNYGYREAIVMYRRKPEHQRMLFNCALDASCILDYERRADVLLADVKEQEANARVPA